jgi:hypothetical protein
MRYSARSFVIVRLDPGDDAAAVQSRAPDPPGARRELGEHASAERLRKQRMAVDAADRTASEEQSSG